MTKRPDTRYQMMWCGKWRPVLRMWDGNGTPTTLALRAVKLVLWCDEPPDFGYVATLANPGEIVERFDRDQKAREWEYVN